MSRETITKVKIKCDACQEIMDPGDMSFKMELRKGGTWDAGAAYVRVGVTAHIPYVSNGDVCKECILDAMEDYLMEQGR